MRLCVELLDAKCFVSVFYFLFFLLGLLCRELKVGIYLWIWKYLLSFHILGSVASTSGEVLRLNYIHAFGIKGGTVALWIY